MCQAIRCHNGYPPRPAPSRRAGILAGRPAAYQEGPGGGTSASAPLIAGMQADAQQAAGTPIGFANPVIYRLYGTSAYHDVTDDPLGPGTELDAVLPDGLGGGQPELDTFGMDLGLSAAPGYDNATGVGSPSRHYFALLRQCPRKGMCRPVSAGDRSARS
jgi:hypothetical protein